MRLFANSLVGLAIVSAVGTVQALPITDIYTPATAVTLSTGTPYIFQHDLVALGFNPLVDTLTNATLTLGISGPNGQNLTIELDGISSTNTLGTWDLATPFAVNLASLQSDGILNLSLTKGGGRGSTFTFTGSTLFVGGIKAPLLSLPEPTVPTLVSVPEPTVLTLLGLSLVSIRLTVGHRRTKS